MLEKVNNSRREQVINLRKAGLTYAEIGRKVGLTRERVRQIITMRSTVKKKPARNAPDVLLTPAEAAELLNVHANTVRRWSNKGILGTYRIGSRGDRRLKRQGIDNMLLKKPAIDPTSEVTEKPENSEIAGVDKDEKLPTMSKHGLDSHRRSLWYDRPQ